MFIMESGGEHMKILFQMKANNVELVDNEKLIFKIDGKFVNEFEEEIQVDENLYKKENLDDYEDSYEEDDWEEEEWYQPWMEYTGLEEQLKSESVVEPLFEIDDVFGQYGFKNEAGEFVIEPQYAYAREFTNGLAAVNLGRTWYRTEEGKKYYENHYGYIDSKGKTIIGFQYDEARPFNKYGVAVVYDIETGWKLIDQTGQEIQGTRFGYLSKYYDYNDRFIEFSYKETDERELVGIYDTKERKVIMEPSASMITELSEGCILVDVCKGEIMVVKVD